MAAKGLGESVWWGVTPSMDLSDVYDQVWFEKADKNGKLAISDSDTFSVLLVGAADLRHVLRTMASCTGQTDRQLHFYMLEASMENYARHIAFLSLLTESLSKVGLQERIEYYLELTSNSLVRGQTMNYLRKSCEDWIRMVTDDAFQKLRLPLIDLSTLKYKERDILEGIFKFWRHQDDRTFDIATLWDERIRHYLTSARYDARDGVFDWDYHMKLGEMVPIVNSLEYKRWRHNGVAYQLREDAVYETPNRTLASGVLTLKDGERIARRGYWGDIVNSPYISIGSESDNKELFKKANGKYVKTSSHVAEYNMLQYMQQIFPSFISKSLLANAKTQSNERGLTIVEEVEEEEEEEEEEGSSHNGVHQNGSQPKEARKKVNEMPLLPEMNVRITLLPLGPVADMAVRGKFHKRFHMVYLSNSMVHHLTDKLLPMLRDDPLIMAETAKFLLDLKEDQKMEYDRKVTKMAETLNFKPTELKVLKENYLLFKKT